ncbi:MAG: XRE family transcriptional regulator [Pseudomonadota bacterium]
MTARTLRLDLGLTLDDISSAAGLSKGHLSRFERGEKSLSPAALARLADALEVPATRLTGHEVPNDWITIIRKDERSLDAVTQNGSVRYRYTGLSKLAQTADTFFIELPPDDQPTQTEPRAGHQGMFVVEGSIDLALAGRTIALQAGDWIEFPAHLPHSLKAHGGPARFLLTIAAL